VVVPAPVIAPEPEPEPEPEEELSFAEALAKFEQGDAVVAPVAVEGEEVDEERDRKLKEDRRKRQTLVFDEELGKVVAQKKHKGARGKDWLDEIEE